ncbi:metal ABC transporter permease [Candidatus Bathyarchaeota archaeon]|nr:metal ABC transporter permease [Candidatus Bathyarchaeota archaeon]
MLEFLGLAISAAVLSGNLCGAIGFYVQRLKITTLSFSVAHAALAGASIGLILNLDPVYSAMVTAVASALFLGMVFTRIEYGRELISMAVFSVSSAVAIFAIYLSNVRVLATVSISVVLWGSLLAITVEKLILLLLILFIFVLYILAYRIQIDSMLYDVKMAEAEGVNVQMHMLIMLFFAGLIISSSLRLTGGFLVFTLLYNPVATSFQISRRAHMQLLASSILGAVSASSGLMVSYILDWPVGATIAIVSSIILLLAYTAKIIAEAVRRRCLSRPYRLG